MIPDPQEEAVDALVVLQLGVVEPRQRRRGGAVPQARPVLAGPAGGLGIAVLAQPAGLVARRLAIRCPAERDRSAVQV